MPIMTDWRILPIIINLSGRYWGVETEFGEGKRYSMQSIKDNVSLLDDETINKINEMVVRAGHQLVKKKVKDSILRRIRTYWRPMYTFRQM